MGHSFPVVYLLVLVAISVVTLAALRAAQKAASEELGDVLLRQGDARRYLQMLQSGRLKLIFRKSSLLLMRLDGLLELRDASAVSRAFAEAESGKIRFRPEERLYLEQKRMDWAVQSGDGRAARRALKALEGLLGQAKDAKPRAVLADARLLEGVYIEKNTGLIPELRGLEAKQTGAMRGVTRFRLAKLFWFGKNEKEALSYLALAGTDLAGTAWETRVRQASEDPARLEVL